MTRIIFEFLLIFFCGGIILYTAGEKTNSTEKTISIETTTELNTENILTGHAIVTENATEFINYSNQTYSSLSSSTSDKSGKAENETNPVEPQKLRTEAPFGSKQENISSGAISSGIDYGGYSENNESKPEKEVFLSEALLKSDEKEEFIPLKANVPSESTLNFEVKPSPQAGSFLEHLTTLASLTQSYSSTAEPTDSAHNSTIFYSNYTSLNVKEETNRTETGPFTVLSTPHQNLPKSVTIKRSLNSTRYAAYGGNVTIEPSSLSSIHSSNIGSILESNQNDKFATVSKLLGEADLEEFSTPLPLEIANKKPESQGNILSSIESSSMDVGDSDFLEHESKSTQNIVSIKENSTPSAEEISKVSTKAIGNIQKQGDTATRGVSAEDGDLEEVLNGNKHESENPTTPPRENKFQTLPNNVLAPESDDIIFAGFAPDEPLGVTFDPDGMKNDFTQDPDSIIFSVDPNTSNKVSSERYVDTNHFDSGKASTRSSTSAVLPHDAPETEFDVFNFGNSSESLPQSALKLNESELVVSPAVVFGKPASDNPEDMLKDASPLKKMNESNSEETTKAISSETLKENNKENASSILTSQTLTKPSVSTTEASKKDTSDDMIIHSTEESVIRPVEVISPEKYNSTSISTKVPMAQPTEFYTSNSQSLDSSDNSSSKNVDTFITDASSPVILPNPAPSITEKIAETVEVSTVVMEPELVDLSSDRNTSLIGDYENSSPILSINSTLEDAAVKTSVSVSYHLQEASNGSLEIQNLSTSGPFISILNSSHAPTTNTSQDNALLFALHTALSTDTVTATSTPSTSTEAFKIRKPGIRVPGASDATAVRTRKPYIPPKPRLSTTAGPPVSIFKKSRTRLNSITSSTTGAPLPKFSTIRIHYASRMPGIHPGGEMVVSVEPITTTVPPTTTTEEPISELPFTDQTIMPNVFNENETILVKVAGGIVLKQGLRWMDQLNNRHSPEFNETSALMKLHLEQIFRSSSIASSLYQIEIDGFNGTKNSRNVEVDFYLYLIKSPDKIAVEHLARVFHEKLNPNNTFARYRVDPSRTAFEMLNEEPLIQPTPSPEEDHEPPVPQWAIAVIVIFAASMIFVVLFATVTMYGRYHRRRRYGNKLSEDELDRSGEWESKMTAAYENMAADTIYDAEDLRDDTYKKQSRIATFHGIPSTLKRCDSWSSGGWSSPPKRKKPPHVH